ncbi:hypothetical protein LTR09_011111 [Extremus antarcticus]|uniref:Pentatricopeptide repeat protein n=1 Tax=Extremus antarcticus TaxID=702011 RepID=A0AAJ0DCX9_9PEZI|nr:hypothetical protein LTR09_011111 [Extremus antarcticus]
MLASGLQRTQLELHLHRRWLQAFLGTTTRSYATISKLRIRKDEPTKVAVSQSSRQKTSGRAFPSAKTLKFRRHGLTQNQWEPTTQSPPEPDAATKALLRQREHLREAVADLRIWDLIRLYDELKDKSIFNRHDFRLVAQCLHLSCRRATSRSSDPRQRREETDQLVAFGEKLVGDVKQGVVEPNGPAHVHLLGFFKEVGRRDPGIDFWTWLVSQDESFVTVDVYGAAIELLAVTGAPLAELEELYQQALVRFPGNFAAYHLAPDAFLSNRDQAVRLPGIPMSLLQGILTARLLHGDTRNAYLALDTALRLYPDQTPPRFFTLFLEERPLTEAYTVLAIACRAGIVVPVNVVKAFQSKLRETSDPFSTSRHSLAVRAQLSLLFMYGGAGGRLTQNMLTEFTISVTRFLRLAGVSSLETAQMQQLVKDITNIVRNAIAIFVRFGTAPGLSAFNSIINNVGGYGRSKEVIGIALADAQALGLKPNEVTHRSILTAAGMLGERDFVVDSWERLMYARHEAKQSADGTDWHTFVKAAHLADCVDLARREFEALKDSISVDQHPNILAALEQSGVQTSSAEKSNSLDVQAVFAELEKINNDLQMIDEQTKHRPGVQDFNSQQLPMTLLFYRTGIDIPETTAIELYDELSTEQAPTRQLEDGEESRTDASVSPPTSTPPVPDTFDRSAPHKSTQTNIPLGRLRFDNWKTMNWLLGQSAANDQAYLRLVDKAIAAGTVPPQRNANINIDDVDEVGSYGLSDVIEADERAASQHVVSENDLQDWRKTILALRGKDS